MLETIIRHELGVPEDQDVRLSDGSPALQCFAKFMTIPEKQAREIWDAFRNGLLHRAMIKGFLDYELTGKYAGRPAAVDGGLTTVYVWDFRNAVVKKLAQHHRKLWKGGQNSLPGIHVNA